MTVYPDLAFLLGFVIHGAISILSLRLLDLCRPRWMILLSAVLGGICSAIIIIPKIPALIPALTGLSGMVFLLRGKSFLGTIRNFISCLILFVLYLGVFFILSSLIFCVKIAAIGNDVYFLSSFVETLISALISFAIGTLAVKARRKLCSGPPCCACRMLVLGKEISFRCYIDTANFLNDPLSGLPVVIVEYEVLRRCFGIDFPLPMTYEFSSMFSASARVIPFRSVSGDGRMLSAFVPESFFVNGVPRKAVIAVSDRRLESRGRFSGIIGPDLIGGMPHEF